MGGDHEVPTGKLLATDGFWGMDSKFSSGMWPLKSYLCANRWFYGHAQTGSTKWTQCVLKEEHLNWEGNVIIGGRGGKEGAGGEMGAVVGNRDTFDQMIISMYEILNKKNSSKRNEKVKLFLLIFRRLQSGGLL